MGLPAPGTNDYYTEAIRTRALGTTTAFISTATALTTTVSSAGPTWAYVVQSAGSITSWTLAGAVDGQRITLFVMKTLGGSAVAWPTNIRWANNTEPTWGGDTTWTMVDLYYSSGGSCWYEVTRSVNMPNTAVTPGPNVKTAAYTLSLRDAGNVVEGDSATGMTFTVPPSSGYPFPIGTQIEICQVGAGQITLAPGSGVTIQTPRTLITRTQWSTVVLRKRATDEWVLSGDAQ